MTCHLVRIDSLAIKFGTVEIAFISAYFVGGIITPMKEGRKPEYPEKTPGDELQKMPHTTARRFKHVQKSFYHDRNFPVIVKNEFISGRGSLWYFVPLHGMCFYHHRQCGV